MSAREYAFHTVDVFTDRAFSGNPLAVLPDADGLTDAEMLAIAREFNLSETAFVLPPESPRATCRVRIFTPGGELPFAGHPTLGTAHVLASIGRIELGEGFTSLVLEEGAGLVEVRLTCREGKPVFARLTAPRLPELGPPAPPMAELARMLSLDAGELIEGENGAAAVSCGVPFLFVPLHAREAVQRVRLNLSEWERTLGSYWATKVFVFSPAATLAPVDFDCRMFAPGIGIAEDPATGSAAVALAGLLGLRDPRPAGTLRWSLAQGEAMGRPSRMHVEAEKREGAIVAVRVGGTSVLVSEGTLTVPPPSGGGLP